MTRSLIKLTVLLFTILSFFGCGVNRFTYYDSLNTYLSQKKYTEASKLVEDNADKFYGNKDLLLYYLDQGYLFHVAGNYEKSNLMLLEARKLATDYFTKSITTEASTFLISDNVRPYYGEDFERALSHVFSALNYVYLNKWEDALVEARAVDHFLKTLQTNYGYKNIYKEDAFVRYLMGMLYENAGEINDAFISYRQALLAYQEQHKTLGTEIPQELFNNTLETATRLGFREEKEELAKDFPKLYAEYEKQQQDKNDGEIIVLHYAGLAPHKIDSILEIAFGKAWAYVGQVKTEGETSESIHTASTAVRAIAADQQIVVAFPKYVFTPYNIKASIIELNEKSAPTEVVEDIGKIAIKNLEDRIGRIYGKSLARAAIKYALSRAAQKRIEEKTDNAVGAFLLSSTVKMAAAMTEKADKRCWQVIPNQIRMARFKVLEGTYSLKCNYYNESGAKVGQEEKTDIKVRKGKKTFVLVQTVN